MDSSADAQPQQSTTRCLVSGIDEGGANTLDSDTDFEGSSKSNLTIGSHNLHNGRTRSRKDNG